MSMLAEDELSRLPSSGWRVRSAGAGGAVVGGLRFSSRGVTKTPTRPIRQRRGPAVRSGWSVAALGLLGLIGCNEDDQRPVADATAAGATAYVREVGADDPLGHWRMDGGVDVIQPGAIEG